MDVDNSGTLSLAEFCDVLDKFKIPGIDQNDYERLFKLFDRNGDSQIQFEEFMAALCGEMSSTRQRLVKEAFDKLDAN